MKKLTIFVFTLITTIILIGQVIKAEEYLYPPATDAQVEESGKLINNDSIFVREEAACMLAYSRNPKAIKYLIEALSDKEDSVKTYAIIGIGELGGKEQITILIEMLKTENKEYLMANLINSLQKIGIDETGEETISPCVTDLIIKGWQVADTVAAIKNEKVKSKLIDKMYEIAKNGKTNKAKINAAHGIVKRFGENPEKYEDLSIDILNSSDEEYEKLLSIRLLEYIGTEKAISAIEKALNDKDNVVRFTAEQTLKRLND